MNRRVTSLSLKEKLEVLNDLKNDMDKRDLCAKYKINKSTMNRIIKSEEQIRNIAVTGKNLNRKRQRNGIHGKVEKALETWIKEIRDDNITPSQTMILDKAKELAVKLNEDFNPGLSWLYRWCKRENIKIGKSHAKSYEVKNTDETYYTQNFLPHILQDYKSECIFNAQESGLYYKAVPNLGSGKEMKFKDYGNISARFTILFICNATGSFKKLYTIGTHKITTARNLSAPLPYFVSKGALLTSALWNAILSALDAEMCVLNKKIVLFVHKITCHQITSELRNVQVQFLQPHSKILIQPLDVGIIKAFKVKYREQMVKRQLCAFEKGQSTRQFLNSFSVLQALFLVKQAWSMIKADTIAKCFEKSGFVTREASNSIEVDKNSILKLIPNKSEYIHIDDNIKCTETISKIKLKIKKEQYPGESSFDTNSEDENHTSEDYGVLNDEDDNDSDQMDENDTEIPIPTAKEALLAIETLQNFCLFHNIESDSLAHIEQSICKELIKQVKHNGITDNF